MRSRADRLALLLSVLAVCVSFLVAAKLFEQLPHTEDEISYLWQARVFASGKLSEPTPAHAQSMFVPFVVDYHGSRFSKYPPGWPAVLALGVRVGAEAWVNPLLAGIAVWLTYLFGKRLFNAAIGLLAAALTLSSPFFLLNSGSFLSSSLALTLTGLFALGWLAAFTAPTAPRPNLAALVAGLSLGWLALTRPLSAVGVAFPFGIHGLILLIRGDWSTRKRLFIFVAAAALTSGLLFVWQYLMTGNALLNPYTLWWSFDKIGFGKGYGISTEGHNLNAALSNTAIMLDAARRDVFGWGNFSWLLLPFGIWTIRKNKSAWMVAALFASLVVFYMLYWAQVTRYGPRYYYEGLYSLTLLSAAGIHWLAGKSRTRLVMAVLLMIGLVGYNLSMYLPKRFDTARAIYGITRAQLAPFQTAAAQKLTPALVFVALKQNDSYGYFYSDWPQYGGLLELQSPDLTSPFIFAVLRGNSEDTLVMHDFPNRRVLYYYPDTPDQFYSAPRQ